MNIRYFNKLTKLLPEPVRQFGGLVSLTFVVIFSFAILNAFFGQGDELVEKMKKEEARIAEANKLSKIISNIENVTTMGINCFSPLLVDKAICVTTVCV